MRMPIAAIAGLAVASSLWGSIPGLVASCRRTHPSRSRRGVACRCPLVDRRAQTSTERRRDHCDRHATVSNEKGYPIQRSTLARLIRVINAGKPRAIAIDILLVDETLPEADEALAKALKESPTIIAAAGKFDPSASSTPFGTPRTSSVLWPATPFDRVAESGLVNIATDSSGTPRHLPLLFETDRGLQPSFVLRGAALVAGNPEFRATG